MRSRGPNILVERLTNMYIIDYRLMLDSGTYQVYDPNNSPETIISWHPVDQLDSFTTTKYGSMPILHEHESITAVYF